MKMNKKGFTLIEMLVVIAIIAVLVAIVIPTVTSATDKAEAAAIAANLRSAKAEIVTAMLSGDTEDNAHWTFTVDADGDVTAVAAAADYDLPFEDADKFAVTVEGTDVTVTLIAHKTHRSTSKRGRGFISHLYYTIFF